MLQEMDSRSTQQHLTRMYTNELARHRDAVKSKEARHQDRMRELEELAVSLGLSKKSIGPRCVTDPTKLVVTTSIPSKRPFETYTRHVHVDYTSASQTRKLRLDDEATSQQGIPNRPGGALRLDEIPITELSSDV
ncbi:hypothetical protein HBH98_242590 [Parastagonospora nodorum]|nr:hypothetical protein HBH53_256060 [Parastagonospora nodorum]KAH3992537.1 hypothetical protein HBI10_214040 [Parastagonospora nodorum]KAH4010561.1 hypothetical protein HBI13_209490 [Parastagonospora nodorum]KAH4043903.1 hypothetical protein HBH49_228080 [Parastagonospora nodorum]KAH4095188.1 hypothetical protein HBH46_172380 [Parastagonospora nodorum]